MRTLAEAAQDLANAHRQYDPQTTSVIMFPSASQSELRLVEITTAVPASGDIVSFRMGADPRNGVDYPSNIVLLNPEEWERIQNGELSLPDGWNLTEAQEL